jgi:serpin B
MVLLGPDPGTFARFEEVLDAETYGEIIDALRLEDFEFLSLPKFGFSGSLALKPQLAALGIVDTFNPVLADFSGISPSSLHVDDIYHGTYISVDERGTEAAAVSSAAMEVEGAVELVHFAIDRPFVFIIRDTDTGAILFIGRVVDPRGID